MAVMLSPLALAMTAHAQAPLPKISLKTPGREGVALKPVVRVLVEAQDCSASPTVTVVAKWRRRSGRATLEIDGRKRLIDIAPRPFSVRTDRFTFGRVSARRRAARVRVRLVTDWLTPSEAGKPCEVRLPQLIGQGASASAAARGMVRLRTPASLESATRAPQRTTAADRVWTCGGGQTNAFDCGVRASLVVPLVTSQGTDGEKKSTDKPKVGNGGKKEGGNGDDPPEGAIPLLALVAGLTAGGIAIGATKRSKDGSTVTDTWNERARKEFDAPNEPISARAADLTKFGAPVATVVVTVAASLGGVASDADANFKVIAVAVVVATAVGGLFYVFAADFRSRAAATVARFEALAKLTSAEVSATDEAQKAADAKVSEAEAKSKALIEQADKAKDSAEKEKDKASKEREAAAAKAATADQKVAEANERAEKAESKAARAEAEIAELEAELQRRRQGKPAPPVEPSDQPDREPDDTPPLSELVRDFEELADKLAAIARSFRRTEPQ